MPERWRDIRVVVPLLVAVAVAVTGVVLVVLFPQGADTPKEAAFAAAEETAVSQIDAVASQPWGEGRLVLVGFEADGGTRYLGIAFVIDSGRGWHVAAYTEQPTDETDVGVGSLLIARAEGGEGQPAWSAAFGELADDRIADVEVLWADGRRTRVRIEGDAYLSVREGTTDVTEVRYLSDDGTEIALIDVDDTQPVT